MRFQKILDHPRSVIGNFKGGDPQKDELKLEFPVGLRGGVVGCLVNNCEQFEVYCSLQLMPDYERLHHCVEI